MTDDLAICSLIMLMIEAKYADINIKNLQANDRFYHASNFLISPRLWAEFTNGDCL